MNFRYKARSSNGKFQTGIVKASNQDIALELLKKNNLDVFSLEMERGMGIMDSVNALFSGIGAKDLAVFSRQLAVLIESNVPIVRALRTLINQTDNDALRKVCSDMATSVEGGDSFSEALSKHPKYFDNFFTSVVKSGESSGDLKRSLIYLADHVEKGYELKRKIQGALTYPVFILLAFSGIFFFLTISVLPQLTSILKESGVALPWTTKIIIKVSDFMSGNWIFVLVVFLVGIVSLVYYFTTDLGKKNRDLLMFKMPIFGKLIRYSYITRFAENLSVLLSQGVSIVKSLGIIAEILDHDIYQQIVIKIMQSVEKGQSMAEPMLENEEAFPPMVPQMLKIGEETGRTSQILKNIERFYSREVDNMTQNMTALIEPFLIIILGAGTGILVAAIIMPIYDMAGSL